MDRRADPRVDVRLPCHVEFPKSKSRLLVGLTENMSRSGILVTWNADGLVTYLPKPGDVLSVDIELPANHSFGRRCMHCQAVVARVSAGESGDPLVALQVNQMQFRSYSNGRVGSRAGREEVRSSVM
ncbi:MAG: PilZ domain-containing protein [Bryobacteraceae bacterium]